MSENLCTKVTAPEASLRKLRAEREEKLITLMDRLGLDVLVALSGGARGQRGNVRFLANYATTSQSSCVLWARAGVPRLLVPYSVHRYWAESMSWIEDIQVDPDYPNAIARYLREQDCDQGKIGWAGPPLLLDAVRLGFEALPLQMDSVLVRDAFSDMRTIKTAEELKLVRRCAAIADEVLKKVAEEVRPGVSERDLVAEAEYVARRLGSEGTSMLISRGTELPQPMLQDSALEPGDVLQFSVELEGPGGLWVQMVRMYALGEPPKDLIQLVEKGIEAEKQAMSLLRDGCKAADIAKVMLAVLGQEESALAIPLGHGIGLDNSEPPRISAGSTHTLRADMNIVIHPTEYRAHSAMFLGNTYVVKDSGVEKLSSCLSELVIV
ncbi:MAG: aminopeptidase P family protein [Chloroflexi bacterium]|nr:aminopeptidase P family protein [Chloroflexota bacterium]